MYSEIKRLNEILAIAKKGYRKRGPTTHVWGSMVRTLDNIFQAGKYTRNDTVLIMEYLGYKSFRTDIYCAMKGKGRDAKRFPYKVVLNEKNQFVYDKSFPKGSWGN